jgi:hypothetical protein
VKVGIYKDSSEDKHQQLLQFLSGEFYVLSEYEIKQNFIRLFRSFLSFDAMYGNSV